MQKGLLPIGSVVLLNGSKKKVMVAGVCQKSANDPDKIWDYTGIIFPEGFIAADKMFMFNNEDIMKLFFIGFQDEEGLAFKKFLEEQLAKKTESESSENK